MNGISVLIRIVKEPVFPSPSALFHVRIQDVSSLQPEKGLSQELDHAGSLISDMRDLQPPER